MRKKTIFILLLLFLATFGFSACTALYEDRDKIVEDEMDKYNVQIAAYDRLEKNFDYTDSVRAVQAENPNVARNSSNKMYIVFFLISLTR